MVLRILIVVAVYVLLHYISLSNPVCRRKDNYNMLGIGSDSRLLYMSLDNQFLFLASRYKSCRNIIMLLMILLLYFYIIV